jgi:hypothetical protein
MQAQDTTHSKSALMLPVKTAYPGEVFWNCREDMISYPHGPDAVSEALDILFELI